MELQPGDRLSDERAEWQVVGQVVFLLRTCHTVDCL